MTVHEINTVVQLIEEMGKDGVQSVYEYTNAVSKEILYAVFAKSQHDDMYESPFVKSPKLIWIDGKFVGEYVHLNNGEV